MSQFNIYERSKILVIKIINKTKIPIDVGAILFRFLPYCKYVWDDGCMNIVPSGGAILIPCNMFSIDECAMCNPCKLADLSMEKICMKGMGPCIEPIMCSKCNTCEVHCTCHTSVYSNPYASFNLLPVH